MELVQHSPQQLPRLGLIWKGLFYRFLGIHEQAKLFLWKFRVVIGEWPLNEIFIGDFILFYLKNQER
jgi:hypothetical protein